jgi:protein-disulfide isomerase
MSLFDWFANREKAEPPMRSPQAPQEREVADGLWTKCPACGVYNPFIKKLLTDYSGKINYTFRNFPLSQHKNTEVSSAAALAAGIQGKYFQMHDVIFENQTAWAALPDPSNIFIGYAKDLGLNTDQFTSDMKSSKVKDIITSDTKDGTTVGISETPTFYINGRKIALDGTYDQFKNLVEGELNSK